MSDKFAICDDGSNDDSMLDSYAATGTAVLEPGDGASATDVEWTGARCEKCDARLVSDVVSICRQCGWYASLGQFVEVDPNWEIDSEPVTDGGSNAAAVPFAGLARPVAAMVVGDHRQRVGVDC